MTPDGPFHQRLKCRANTPDEAVAAFLSQTPMVRCEAYRCLLTEAECRARKRKAVLAKRLTYHGYTKNIIFSVDRLLTHMLYTCQIKNHTLVRIF